MNLDAKTIDGWSPFMYAAVNGYKSLVELLGSPRYNERVRILEAPYCDFNSVDRLKRNSLHWVIKLHAIGHPSKDESKKDKPINIEKFVSDNFE